MVLFPIESYLGYVKLNVMNWTPSSMGKKGAAKRNEVLTKEQRHVIAVNAGKAKKGVKHKKKRKVGITQLLKLDAKLYLG